MKTFKGGGQVRWLLASVCDWVWCVDMCTMPYAPGWATHQLLNAIAVVVVATARIQERLKVSRLQMWKRDVPVRG